MTKTQGSCSKAGCNYCYFKGVKFGGSVVYPFYSSYLSSDDVRRRKRPTNVLHSNLMYRRDETEPPP